MKMKKVKVTNLAALANGENILRVQASSRLLLCNILGYLLKSLIHTPFTNSRGPVMSIRSTSVGEVSCSPGKTLETLRGYIMEFNPETVQRCANPRSKEAATVIERQICELFEDERTGLVETNELICTSFATLKRFVLEGIAFGSFLWDAEDFVGTVYELKDN